MSKVRLKWDGKAVIGQKVIGTWYSKWEYGAAAFYGETDGKEKSPSSGMLKHELREWFRKSVEGPSK